MRPPITLIPAKLSRYALMIHWRPVDEASRLRWMVGRATSTTKASMAIIDEAQAITPSTHQG